MRPQYRYMPMRGLGDNFTQNYTFNDTGAGGGGSADQTVIPPASQPAAPAAAASDGFDWSGFTNFASSIAKDFGSLTGSNSQANTGGADYASQQQGAPPPSGAPGAGAPSGAPPGSSPVAQPGSFFNSATCANAFCYQDLYDFSQPYPYVIMAGIVALLMMGNKK